MWHYGFLHSVNHAYVISRVNCIHIGVGFDVVLALYQRCTLKDDNSYLLPT